MKKDMLLPRRKKDKETPTLAECTKVVHIVKDTLNSPTACNYSYNFLKGLTFFYFQVNAKEERKRSMRPRLSATIDGDKDSQLDSKVSAHRTPYGRLLHSEYFTLVSTDPSHRLYSLLNH